MQLRKWKKRKEIKKETQFIIAKTKDSSIARNKE